MSEYSELVKRLRDHLEGAGAALPHVQLQLEAAQAIERLEGEGAEREKQFADLLESHEEDLDALEKAEQQLTDARAREDLHKALLDKSVCIIVGMEIVIKNHGDQFTGLPAAFFGEVEEALAAPAPGKDSEGKE